jgi:hypothetical protein
MPPPRASSVSRFTPADAVLASEERWWVSSHGAAVGARAIRHHRDVVEPVGRDVEHVARVQHHLQAVLLHGGRVVGEERMVDGIEHQLRCAR